MYALYAQYFNTENEDCAEKHDWSLVNFVGQKALPLTVERREKFNKLVRNINNAIKEVVDEYKSSTKIGYRITTADWDVWPRQAVVGQFCVPGTGRNYPDESQPELHFFRPGLGSKEPGEHDNFKRRAFMSLGAVNETGAEQFEAEVYNSMFYSSANPAAEAISILRGRAAFPAHCPGDDSILYGLGLPDRWGKWFHPNELGHRTIASFVLEAIFAERAELLGVANEACSKKYQLDCYDREDTGSQYVTADTMDRTYKVYCDEVDLRGDSDERVFYDNTPDGHRYRIYRSDSSSEFSVEKCKSAFKKLVHGCWSGSPMNWKMGGSYAEGGFIYIVRPRGNKRPWPMIEKPDGECFAYIGSNEAIYTLRGVGWASWDRGRETLYKAISRCTGTDIENNQWRWEYFDDLQDGMEWQVTFTLDQGNFYCFYNEQVQAEVGAFTHGCIAMYPR